MPFPLRRLPLLALREVIKSMNTKEIFYLSVLSKKSQNFVMLSIPKGSFNADFFFEKDGLLFELKPSGFSEHGLQVLPDPSYSIRGNLSLMKVSTNNHHVQCDFSSSSDISEVEESSRELFHRFSKTFKNSKTGMKFEDGTREDFAMEIMRFAWENGFQLDRISFELKDASSESVQELLNGCNEHHTSLYIETIIPMGFKCTSPPGGYKYKTLSMRDAHWINLDDFLQCRTLFFEGGPTDMTVEYLNGLLKKIANLECRLESFIFKLETIQPTDFPEIVRGLSENAIRQAWQGLQFKRRDGLKLIVALTTGGYFNLHDDYL